MLANQVEKLFYHAGASSRFNAEELEGIFFRYGGVKRRNVLVEKMGWGG